jgi:hypothetical protein
MVACVGQATAATDNAYPSRRQAALNLRQSPQEDLETTLLGPPLLRRCISPDSSNLLSGWHLDALLEPADGSAQAGALFPEIVEGPVPLIIDGSGDRASPAAAGDGGESSLAIRPSFLALARLASRRQVLAGQATQVFANLEKHRLVGGAEA